MYYCQKCGAQVQDGQVCRCGGGQPQQQQQQFGQQPFRPSPMGGSSPAKSKAMTGMILGIISILFPIIGATCVCTAGWNLSTGHLTAATILSVVGLVAAVLGIAMSANGMKELRLTGQPIGMGIAGLVCAILGIVICLAVGSCNACACYGANQTYGAIGGWGW